MPQLPSLRQSPSSPRLVATIVTIVIVTLLPSTSSVPPLLLLGADAAAGLSFIGLVNGTAATGSNSSKSSSPSCSMSTALSFFNIPDTRVDITVMTPARSDNYSIYCNLQFSFKNDVNTCVSNSSSSDCPEPLVKNSEGVVVSRNYSVSPTAALNTLFRELMPSDLDALALLQIRRSDVIPNVNPTVPTTALLTSASAFEVVPAPGMGVGYAGAVRLQIQPNTMWGSVSTTDMPFNTPTSSSSNSVTTTALLVCQAAFPTKTFYTAAFFSGAGFDTGFIAASGLYSDVNNDTATSSSNSASLSLLQVKYINTLTSSTYPGYLPTHSTDLGVICGNDTFRLTSNSSAPTTPSDVEGGVNITYTCYDPLSEYSCPKVATYIEQRSMGLIPTTSYITQVENTTHSIFKIVAGGGGFTKMDLNGVLQSLAPSSPRNKFAPDYTVALGGSSGSASHNDDDAGEESSSFLTPTTVIIMIAAGVMLVVAIALLTVPLMKKVRLNMKPPSHYSDEMFMMPAPPAFVSNAFSSFSDPSSTSSPMQQPKQDDVEL